MPLAGRWCNGPGRGGPMYRSVPARCLTGRCHISLQLRHELVRRQIRQARVRSHFVEMALPRFDDDLGLGSRAEPFEAEAFIAELAVETLGDAILPRLAWIDQCGADAFAHDPAQQ